jgi:O-antigen ligase
MHRAHRSRPRDGNPHAPGLSTIETAFVGVTAATIFASSWLLGGRFLWAQWIILGLCSTSFLLGLAVFVTSCRSTVRAIPDWKGWSAASLALVGFVAFVGIQAANVAYVPLVQGNSSILTPVSHLAFLPSSVGGPFDGVVNTFVDAHNSARYLLVYGAVVLGSLAVILGVQRRPAARVLVTVLALHGLVSAVICVAHQWSGTTKVLWTVGDPIQFLGAPFFFLKNQNAAYQTLLTGWVLGWWFQASTRRPRPSTWMGVLVFVVAELGLASIRSRAGMLFAGILAFCWVFYQRDVVAAWWRRRRVMTAVGAAALVVVVLGVLAHTGGIATLRRLTGEGDLVRVGLHGGKYRMLLHQIALEMYKDRPWYGWGSGSYLYVYASYEGRVPEMARNRPNYSYYLVGAHADGDWYEFLAELGIVGTGLFALIWVPHLLLWGRRRIWARPDLFMPALAVLLVLLHGFIDVSFRNIGLLWLLSVTAVLVSKLALSVEPTDSSGLHRHTT